MMPIDGIINGTNGIINQNRGEEFGSDLTRLAPQSPVKVEL